jgi:RNA polymerase-binding transcription factor DksA
MADEADFGNEQARMILENQIKMKRKDIDPYQNDSGICWECGSPVPDRRRWCSKECADASDAL